MGRFLFFDSDGYQDEIKISGVICRELMPSPLTLPTAAVSMSLLLPTAAGAVC